MKKMTKAETMLEAIGRAQRADDDLRHARDLLSMRIAQDSNAQTDLTKLLESWGIEVGATLTIQGEGCEYLVVKRGCDFVQITKLYQT